MSVSINKVFVAGNLTRDIELRYIPSGTAVVDTTVAVNERRKQSDGSFTEETQFVDVTLWGRQAEVMAEYCKKGSPVHIEGCLRLDRWEAEDGSKRSKLKVVAQRMQLLSGRSANNDDVEQPEAAAAATNVNLDEEIPF